MEAEHRGVAEGGRALPLAGLRVASLHPERMGRVVDELEAAPVGDVLERVHVAEVSVDVHRQDRHGVRGDRGLDRLRVEREVGFPHVGKHGDEPLAHDSVGGGGEGEGGGHNLAPLWQPQRFQDALQGVVPVGEERRVGHLEPLLERRL